MTLIDAVLSDERPVRLFVLHQPPRTFKAAGGVSAGWTDRRFWDEVYRDRARQERHRANRLRNRAAREAGR